MKKLLKIEDVATILGLSRSRVYELVAADALPTVRIGRSVRIPDDRLDEWIDSHIRQRDLEHIDGPEAQL